MAKFFHTVHLDAGPEVVQLTSEQAEFGPCGDGFVSVRSTVGYTHVFALKHVVYVCSNEIAEVPSGA